MSTDKIKPVRKENIPVYTAVLLAYVVLSVVGMCIMFGASLLNLPKMLPGFERLARGEKGPGIPPVF